MARVFSTRFFALQGHTGQVGYTCPVGYVAVVRDVAIYWNGSVSARCFIRGAAGETFTGAAWTETDGPPIGWHWDGRYVFVAGETINVYSDHEPVDVSVSGYLLAV